jgi:hypothetical protein
VDLGRVGRGGQARVGESDRLSVTVDVLGRGGSVVEEGRPSAEAGLFAREAVVVGQPKRSRWRRYAGPALAVSTVDGTLLAHVTHTDDAHSLLTKASGECVVRIEKSSRFGQFGQFGQFEPVRFHLPDATNREIGTVDARGPVKSGQHAAAGRPSVSEAPPQIRKRASSSTQSNPAPPRPTSPRPPASAGRRRKAPRLSCAWPLSTRTVRQERSRTSTGLCPGSRVNRQGTAGRVAPGTVLVRPSGSRSLDGDGRLAV